MVHLRSEHWKKYWKLPFLDTYNNHNPSSFSAKNNLSVSQGALEFIPADPGWEAGTLWTDRPYRTHTQAHVRLCQRFLNARSRCCVRLLRRTGSCSSPSAPPAFKACQQLLLQMSALGVTVSRSAWTNRMLDATGNDAEQINAPREDPPALRTNEVRGRTRVRRRWNQQGFICFSSTSETGCCGSARPGSRAVRTALKLTRNRGARRSGESVRC